MPSPGHIKALLVEDNIDDADLLRRALGMAPDIRVELEHVEYLKDALERLAKGGIDVVMLDLNLPDSNGMATVTATRDRFPLVPIVVMTGLDEREVGLEAIQQGAQDYLPKGRFDGELLTRSLLYAMERKRVEEADRELTAARRIQESLFPESAPRLDGLDIAGICRPASAAGGDYYDFVPLGDGSHAILVADVSGHGIGAALMVANTRAYIRALSHNIASPVEIVETVHRMLYEESSVSLFIALFMLVLDPANRTFTYIGAGHKAHHLRAARGLEAELLDSATLPLRVAAEINCQQSPRISLEDDDIVILMTDGINEAQSSTRELFGIGRALDVIRENSHGSAQQMAACLYSASRDHCGDLPQNDDATVVIIKTTS
jgi:CheY-like chemotaxis protein